MYMISRYFTKKKKKEKKIFHTLFLFFLIKLNVKPRFSHHGHLSAA